MTIKEIKVENFIIEVDVNKNELYDIYVWDNKDHFLYSIPNVEFINLNTQLEDLEEWLINSKHEYGFTHNKYKTLVNRIEVNCNTIVNGNKAFEFDDKLIEYDELLDIVNLYQDGNKLFSLEGKSV